MSQIAMHALIGRASAGEDLAEDEMSHAIDGIMRGQWVASDIAMLLTALRHKGESASEVAGAARAMRQHMTAIRSARPDLVDTCGTGGDGSSTFNISTAAALVTAAAGVPVAKHGNRRVSSRSGSADVLEELGVNIAADVPTVERCLDKLGICFCFAPLLHGAMKQVAEVRASLGVPTIFNLLGPLSNPAGAPFQLLGVGRSELRPLLADVLARLGIRRALVVRGDDGLDEVTLAGTTQVTEVRDTVFESFTWRPEDFGLMTTALDALKVDGPHASAAMIRDILSGKRGPARDIVIANAAAALWLVGKRDTPRDAAALAAEAIDTGAASDLLSRLGEMSHS
ncbi:MAG TPA: anthranilate phosphoribosyltransferase [Pirellulales bacterium]|nr:anthranilate phosphoribosyltransferase [Pirellulales bacterium]